MRLDRRASDEPSRLLPSLSTVTCLWFAVCVAAVAVVFVDVVVVVVVVVVAVAVVVVVVVVVFVVGDSFVVVVVVAAAAVTAAAAWPPFVRSCCRLRSISQGKTIYRLVVVVALVRLDSLHRRVSGRSVLGHRMENMARCIMQDVTGSHRVVDTWASLCSACLNVKQGSDGCVSVTKEACERQEPVAKETQARPKLLRSMTPVGFWTSLRVSAAVYPRTSSPGRPILATKFVGNRISERG